MPAKPLGLFKPQRIPRPKGSSKAALVVALIGSQVIADLIANKIKTSKFYQHGFHKPVIKEEQKTEAPTTTPQPKLNSDGH